MAPNKMWNKDGYFNSKIGGSSKRMQGALGNKRKNSFTSRISQASPSPPVPGCGSAATPTLQGTLKGKSSFSRKTKHVQWPEGKHIIWYCRHRFATEEEAELGEVK